MYGTSAPPQTTVPNPVDTNHMNVDDQFQQRFPPYGFGDNLPRTSSEEDATSLQIPPNPSYYNLLNEPYHSLQGQAQFEESSTSSQILPNTSYRNLSGQVQFEEGLQASRDLLAGSYHSFQPRSGSSGFLGQQDTPSVGTATNYGGASWSIEPKANITEAIELEDLFPPTPSEISSPLTHLRPGSVRSSVRGTEHHQMGSAVSEIPFIHSRRARSTPYKRHGPDGTNVLHTQARQGRKTASNSGKGKSRTEPRAEPPNHDGGALVPNLKSLSVTNMVHAVGSPGGLSRRQSLARRQPKFLNPLNMDYGHPAAFNLKSDRRVIPTAVHIYIELMCESDTSYVINTKNKGNSPNHARALHAIEHTFARLGELPPSEITIAFRDRVIKLGNSIRTAFRDWFLDNIMEFFSHIFPPQLAGETKDEYMDKLKQLQDVYLNSRDPQFIYPRSDTGHVIKTMPFQATWVTSGAAHLYWGHSDAPGILNPELFPNHLSDTALAMVIISAHAAIKAKFAQLETGQIPELSENEYDEPFLLYLAMMEAIRQNKFFGPLFDGFLEDLVLIGRRLAYTRLSQPPTTLRRPSTFSEPLLPCLALSESELRNIPSGSISSLPLTSQPSSQPSSQPLVDMILPFLSTSYR